MKNHTYLAYFLLALLITATYFIYQPALNSGFLFDDIPALETLPAVSQDESGAAAWHFITTNNSGILGRYLSMASFALQADDWPNNPYAFKQINLLIHLMNALLIFFCIRTVTHLLNSPPTYKNWLPILLTALWVLTPQHSSTILYTVQRMALLSSFFTLLGVLLYLISRQSLLKKDQLSGYLLMLLACSIPYTLGLLSKENAILFPFYILSIELTLLRHIQRPKFWHYSHSLAITLPVILVILYLIQLIPIQIDGYALSRNYGLTERLMSEARILFEYLSQLFFLSSFNHSIVHFPNYSISLTNPITTAYAVFAWTMLISLAIAYRKQWAIFSFSLCWFLSGHLLESTFINLDLYFEHRNYLASLGAYLGVAVLFIYLPRLLKNKHLIILGNFSLIFPLLFIGMLIATSVQVAQLWSKPVAQAYLWQLKSPTSLRANNHYGITLERFQQYDKAAQFYLETAKHFPDTISFQLRAFALSCHTTQTTLPKINTYNNPALDLPDAWPEYIHILTNLLKEKYLHQCDALNVKEIIQLIDQLTYHLTIATFSESQKILYTQSFNGLAYQFYALDQQFQKAYDILTNTTKDKNSVSYLYSLTELQLALQKPSLARASFDKLTQQCSKKPDSCALFTHLIKNLGNRLQSNNDPKDQPPHEQ